jgi:hypothetical protein
MSKSLEFKAGDASAKLSGSSEIRRFCLPSADFLSILINFESRQTAKNNAELHNFYFEPSDDHKTTRISSFSASARC